MAGSTNKRLILISQAPVRNVHEVLGLLSANRQAVPKNPIPVRPRKLFSSRAEGSALLLVLFTIILLTGLIPQRSDFLKTTSMNTERAAKSFAPGNLLNRDWHLECIP